MSDTKGIFKMNRKSKSSGKLQSLKSLPRAVGSGAAKKRVRLIQQKVGLVIKPGIDDAIGYGKKVLEWAERVGCSLSMDDETISALRVKGQRVSFNDIVAKCDPIVVLGGDGTLIRVARHITGRSPTLLGVNFGRLGFLTEISPEELISTLSDVLTGKAELGKRNMIFCEVMRKGRAVFSTQAVNDVIVQRGATDGLLDIDLSVDSEKLLRVRADGLIVSTPTGSTAYSLAAGGSIVVPSLSVILITPICPHALTVRPVIIDMESTVTMEFPPYQGNIILSADGQESTEIRPGDKICISRSKNSVTFVRSPTKSYFEILREKLNWGLGNSAR